MLEFGAETRFIAEPSKEYGQFMFKILNSLMGFREEFLKITDQVFLLTGGCG